METKPRVTSSGVCKRMRWLLGVVILVAGVMLVAGGCPTEEDLPPDVSEGTIFIPAGSTWCGWYFPWDASLTVTITVDGTEAYLDPPDTPVFIE